MLRSLETRDPAADLLLRGEAQTVEEAEDLCIERNLEEVLRLVRGPLNDEEFRSHPLIQILLSRGSRPWEDSLS